MADKHIGSLWKGITKKGEEFFSGEVNGQKVVIFKNDFKEADEAKNPGKTYPDYRVYPSKEREDKSRAAPF